MHHLVMQRRDLGELGEVESRPLLDELDVGRVSVLILESDDHEVLCVPLRMRTMKQGEDYGPS